MLEAWLTLVCSVVHMASHDRASLPADAPLGTHTFNAQAVFDSAWIAKDDREAARSAALGRSRRSSACVRSPRLHTEHAAALASFEAAIKNAAAGDGQTDLVHKVKFWDKLDALEKLAQHLGILKNQTEVTGLEELFARLDAGRTRNAARKGPWGQT
jgi:hypothetical protein